MVSHEVLWIAHSLPAARGRPRVAFTAHRVPLWISPIVHEANHLARLFGVREELLHRFRLVRQNKVRPDIGQGSKHKLSQVQSWMRQLQTFSACRLVSA